MSPSAAQRPEETLVRRMQQHTNMIQERMGMMQQMIDQMLQHQTMMMNSPAQ